MAENGESTTLPCLLTYVLLLGGPLMAWIYALSVWIMYALSHECTWGSKAPQFVLRSSVVVAYFAISVGLCDEDSKTSSLSTTLPLMTTSLVLSLFLCRWTRTYDVVGVTQAPYYGPRHLEGKNVLITGANSGIGKETSLQLASMGANVYMACRSIKRAEEAIDDIMKACPNIDPSQLQIVEIDLGDMASIRKAVFDKDCLLYKVQTIHVLINNAGLMMGTKTQSKDGMELMMQANHLGHYLLTRLLIPKLSKKDTRIINVTSSTYQLATQGFDFGDIMCTKTRKYTLFGQYAQTKLANILFTKQLATKYPEWKIFAVHPGLVRTNVTSHMPWIMQTLNALFAWYVGSMQKSPSQGAYSNVLCAAAPSDELPPTATYIVNCRPQELHKVAESTEDAERLWNVSKELVGFESSTSK